jgi:sigma-B regulation protein RsbU (phosphoserine phosphatase)
MVVRTGGEVESIGPHGPVLGLLPVARWGSAELVLDDGDLLVLYSDGILESFSPDGREFGLEGIRSSLAAVAGRSAADVGAALLDAAAAHRCGREADDDVTVLVVRFTRPTGAVAHRTGPVDETAM